MRLHNKIINIQIDNAKHDDMTDRERLAYKIGHRDARHAAAELSIGQETQRDQLRETLEGLVALIENERPDWEHEEIHQARAALKATEEDV